MTVHPELIVVVEFLQKYVTETKRQADEYDAFVTIDRHPYGTIWDVVGCLLLDLENVSISEDEKQECRQLLGFIVNNPIFVKAFLEE